MIKTYLIDGNNLIGKIPELWNMQKKSGQASREKLAALIDNFFNAKPQDATIFFDGFKVQPIPTEVISIEYCDNRTADEDIKTEIMRSGNPKLLKIVSSDNSIKQFAKKSSCQVINSEDFARLLFEKNNRSSESEKIKSISNDEIKRMFGV